MGGLRLEACPTTSNNSYRQSWRDARLNGAWRSHSRSVVTRLYKIVVTCKIKHLQNICLKRFRAVDFPRLCRGRENVVKMFYFTRNHRLSLTWVQHAKTFVKKNLKCFANVLQHFLQMFHFTCNRGLTNAVKFFTPNDVAVSPSTASGQNCGHDM